MKYVSNLIRQLEIGENVQKAIEEDLTSERIEENATRLDVPMLGAATYLVSGVLPSTESISFQQVIDEEDARRLVNARRKQWGDNGRLEDIGDGSFRVENHNSWLNSVPEGADETQYPKVSRPGRGYRRTETIIEADGKKMLETTQVLTKFFRYKENFLYEADFEELLTMALPSNDSLHSAIDHDKDVGFNAYLDRIPLGLRQLGWNMLSAAAGSTLQQRDDESDVSYEMRKTSGDLVLTLLETVLFDVDKAEGWAKFATADDGSLRGEVRIRAKNNSQLGKRLREAAGNSLFAPILSDNAAATFHTCIRLPDEAPKALMATAAWITDTVGSEFRSDPAMMLAGESLAGVLVAISEHAHFELLLKAGWSETSDGVLYGSVRLNDNPELLQNLYHVMTTLGSGGELENRLSLEERDGMPIILVQIPEELTEELRGAFGCRLTHLYFAHQNSSLWFAVGVENSVQIIRTSVEQCSEDARAARTPLISARIDMERWLSYPQKDPAGITQMPWWLDERAAWFPPNPMSTPFLYDPSAQSVHPVMAAVFSLGGSQRAGFALEADESGLLLQAELGEALANHMVARMVTLQEEFLHHANDTEEKQSETVPEQSEEQ